MGMYKARLCLKPYRAVSNGEEKDTRVDGVLASQSLTSRIPAATDDGRFVFFVVFML